MIHTCSEMKKSEDTQAGLVSLQYEEKYKIVWNDYRKRFDLLSRLFVELSDITYCPFCGLDLPDEKRILSEQPGCEK